MNKEELLAALANMQNSILAAVDKKFADDKASRESADAAAKKAKEDADKKAKEDADRLKAAEEEVKKNNAAKSDADKEKARFLEAIRFTGTIKEFIEANKKYLPADLAEIVKVLEAKSYRDDVEKAQELKRSVIEQFIKEQKNIDALPESQKALAIKFAGLSTQEKLASADEYYGLVETGIHTFKNIDKFQASEKNGGGSSNEDTAVKEYEEKMIDFSRPADQSKKND